MYKSDILYFFSICEMFLAINLIFNQYETYKLSKYQPFDYNF